jgi:large subunit ribosomal protein L21
MYAIVTIAGQQFKVQENRHIFVHRLDANEGDALSFDQVLLVDNNGTVTIVNSGITTITASQVAFGIYGPASISATLTVLSNS